MYKNTCCLITGLSETGSQNPARPAPTTMSRDYLSLKRNSDGAPLLENSPQTDGMRRILHFRRIKGVLLLRRRRGERSRFSCWDVIPCVIYVYPRTKLMEGGGVNILIGK